MCKAKVRNICFSLALVSLSLCMTHAEAIDRSPWPGNLLEFDGEISQEHTHSDKLATKRGTKHKDLRNNITRLSIMATPLPDWSGELEASFNKSQKYSYALDAIKVSVRKQWFNDIAGDRVSLTTGVVLASPYSKHLHDLSSDNHGNLEGEFNVGIGKEFLIEDTSYNRAWTVVYVGHALEGSPWLGASFHVERILADTHFFQLFLNAEKGYGHKKLTKHTDFKSWSRMDYQYEDIGFRYTYQMEGYGNIYGLISKRIHARFCPKNTTAVEIGLIIPFSF
jgi:hypothetical protein